MAKTSPLHRVIDAARWAAELLLGRLVVLAHAAFLDAGFMPADAGDMSIRLPRQVGMMASTLPLRYLAPQLLHRRPDDVAAAVQLRLRAYGRYLVFYVCIAGTPVLGSLSSETYWTCGVDAVDAAPLLAGGLDDTARALRRDTRTAALWRALTDRLCRRVLVALCARNGVTLSPSFMSLPGEVKAAILTRLPSAGDIARVECTCTGLRRVVADHDAALWKPRYEALAVQRQIAGSESASDEATPEKDMSWKERYMVETTTGWRPAPPKRRWVIGWGGVPVRIVAKNGVATILDPWDDLPWREEWEDHSRRRDSFVPFHKVFDSPEPPEEETVPRRRRRRKLRTMRRDARHCHGHALELIGGGDKKQWHGAGAVHSPSSRFRWKHR